MRVEDVRARARRHGYEVEEFWLGRGGFRPGRVQQILEARGVEGVLVSVQSSRKFGAELDYSKFAAATFGYGLTEPALHRASTNMMHGILGAMQELEARGYRRIGVAISEWVNARADHTCSGAVLHYQQGVPARRRVPLLLFPHNALERDEAAFCRWVRRWRPDALISFHGVVPAWLNDVLKLRIPGDIGLVVHDWVDGMAGWAGIDHCRKHVAAAAVDLVASQLVQNERGVPEVTRQILISPRFVDGPSIRGAR
jgi:LacI family transcriptional regulator